MELRFAPVHDIRRGTVSTFFCLPAYVVGDCELVRGYGAVHNLEPYELPDLDCAMLEHAVAFARKLENAGIIAAIGASVHFETLGWISGREKYLAALSRLDAVSHHFLVIKIDAVPAGVASGRLHDVVHGLRPHARRVFVHLSEHEPRWAGYGRLGAAGIVTSLPPRATRPVVMAMAKSLQRICEDQSAVSCIDGVENATSLDIVRAAGVRFATGEIFAEKGLRADASLDHIRTVIDKQYGCAPAAPNWDCEGTMPRQEAPITSGPS